MDEYELREQDKWLPIANVCRIMKNSLPENAKISKEAKECMQECVSEFVSFITSEASEKCCAERRKTVNGEDILFAMTSLGFENYAEVLKIYLAKYRVSQNLKQEQIAAQRRKARQLHNRQLKQQQELEKQRAEQQQQQEGNTPNAETYTNYATEAQLAQQHQHRNSKSTKDYDEDGDEDNEDYARLKIPNSTDPRYYQTDAVFAATAGASPVAFGDETRPEQSIFQY
jgi:histone H3/H4